MLTLSQRRNDLMQRVLDQKLNLYATGDDFKLLLVDAPYTRESLIRYVVRISSGMLMGDEKETFIGKNRAYRIWLEFANRQIPQAEYDAAMETL